MQITLIHPAVISRLKCNCTSQLHVNQATEPSLMLKSFFLFSDLAALIVKSENKKGVSTSEKARICSRLNKFY